MSKSNRGNLADRVSRAAEEALVARDYVSPLDVFLGIGWIDGGAVKRWQQGQFDCLEDAIQTNPSRIAEALVLLRDWATRKGLLQSEVPYMARTPERSALRFGRGGDTAAETVFRTHWVSSALSERKRERIAIEAQKPPELAVIQPLDKEWKCHHCGRSGDLLIMEQPGPACLRCVGLDDLEFLPSGDALLTRRAKAKSARFAVVVRFSRSRGRYERQGLLVEAEALAAAQNEIAASGRG